MYPLKYVYVTTPYGRPGDWQAGKHTGTDFRAPVGTALYATWGGTVEHVGWGGYGSAYGYHVIVSCITRFGQRRKVLYAHMTSSPLYRGQSISPGEYIGRSGSTGRTFGPHLHYEERVSPYTYYSYAPPVFLSYNPIQLVTVSISKVQPGKKNRHVRRVQRRLNRRLRANIPKTGFFGPLTQKAYANWQRRLGYTGTDADGVPGHHSLQRLGFRVVP